MHNILLPEVLQLRVTLASTRPARVPPQCHSFSPILACFALSLYLYSGNAAGLQIVYRRNIAMECTGTECVAVYHTIVEDEDEQSPWLIGNTHRTGCRPSFSSSAVRSLAIQLPSLPLLIHISWSLHLSPAVGAAAYNQLSLNSGRILPGGCHLTCQSSHHYR